MAFWVALRIATIRAACSLACNFEDRLEHLQRREARDDLIEQLRLPRLIDIGRGSVRVCGEVLHAPSACLELERQELDRPRHLRQQVDEVRVDQIHLIDAPAEELVHRQAADGGDIGECRLRRETAELGLQLSPATHQHLAALAPDDHVSHLGVRPAKVLEREPDDIDVVSSAQPAVTAHQNHQQMVLRVAFGQQRMQVGTSGLVREVLQDLPGLRRVGLRGRHRLLGLARLAGADRLHGARHLRDVVDAADARPHFPAGGHGSVLQDQAVACHVRLNSSSALRMAASVSAVICLRSATSARMAACEVWKLRSIAVCHAFTPLTGTASA